MIDPSIQAKLISLAKEALRNRPDLAGAGQSIMKSYGLDQKTARELQLAEVDRRKREQQA